jgi:hypothetical protein
MDAQFCALPAEGRSNGGVQNAGDDLLRDWIGFESAQGSCGVDGVEQSDIRHREPHVANAFGSLSTSAILATIWGIHHCYSLLQRVAPSVPLSARKLGCLNPWETLVTG